MFAPLSVCAPQTLPFSITATGHLAELLHQLGLVGEQVEEPVRAGEARRPAADDRDADLDPLVLGVGRLDDQVRSSNGGGYSSGSTAGLGVIGASAALLGLHGLGQLGHDLVEVADHAEVANSKIGAFGSLLIARMFSELCIPTLCWIAPEIPAAR